MGIVTEVSDQKKRKNRVNVHIDGEFVCGLDAFIALSEGVKVGREISQSELERIQVLSDGETAFGKAANYLGVRMRSKNEIIRYLTGKGYSNYVIAQVIDKLMKYNYINDDAFTREYINSTGKVRSKRRIRADLMRMGVDENLISSQLDTLEGQQDAADKAAKKYLKSRPYDRNKLAAHLQSKGFEWEIIAKVIEENKNDEE